MVQFHPSPPRRQGVILLLVVIMLALFLVVGLTFFYYAESEASASRIYREAFTVNYDRADIDPGQLLSHALGQLIYDVKDDIDGCDSSMRGHSLARNMYGWRDPSTTPNPLVNTNVTPFNGIGRLPAPLEPSPFGVDPRLLLNYRFFQSDAFVRDPERLGTLRANPTLPITQTNQPYSGGWNVPYTFPDRNNVFLAALKANVNGTPQVLMQSFHRPQGTPFEVPNPNPTQLTNSGPWLDTSNPALKYMVLRPRPVDMYWNGPTDPHSFPLPASDTGDVQNLPGGNGFDSFWIDLGYPVQTTRGGTKFKPLFAFLIVDLDSRVNLNVHGNVRGTQSGSPVHVSNQGIGKWEVNLGRVLTVNPAEVARIFGDTAASVTGRYGANQAPGTGLPAQAYPDFPTTLLRPSMMRLDFDGVDGASGNLTTRFNLPGNYQTLPRFTAGYDHLMEPVAIRQQNPMNYNVLSVNGGFNTRQFNDDRPWLTAENLYYLIGDALSQNHQRSALYAKGVRQNLDVARVRHLLTTLSVDLDTPGVRPWIVNPADPNPRLQYTLATPTDPNNPSQYHARSFTDPVNFQLSTPPSLINSSAAPIVGSDYLPDDGRAKVLSRLDLNRKLAPYPVNPADYANAGPPPPPGTIPDPVAQPYYRALWERQKFAREIFDRLVQATGAVPTITGNSPTANQTNARRYLAQLAVNIVDYIDDDEISTPFYWDDYDPQAVVHGVEAPKLVLNEVYAELRNAKADDGQPFATQNFKLHFWIELFNPRMKATQPDGTTPMTDPVTGDNRADVQLMNVLNSPVYRIQVAEEPAGFTPTDLRGLSNVDGRPTAGLIPRLIAERWDLTASTNPQPPNERIKVHAIDPLDPNFPNGTAGTPGTSPGSNTNGYYVVASENDVEALTPVQEPTNRLPTDNPQPGNGLSRDVPLATTVPAQPRHTVMLQRLACPHLPYNPPAPDPNHNPNLPDNPYITVDYVSNVRVFDAVRVVQFPAVRQAGDGDPPATRRSKARVQPLAAAYDAVAPAPQYSFFAPNSAASQYDWLVHLDRPPISVMELLHVSAFKPHEITQTFTDAAGGNKFGHRAPWTQLENRLYRGLEYLTVGDRGNWTTVTGIAQSVQPSTGGRKPGMMNLNTMWDQELLNALTDPQSTNYFQQTDVDNSWTAIRARRSQSLGGTAAAGTAEQPFMSFANPAQDPQPNEFPTRAGLDGTLFANGVFPGPAGQPHPYIKDEMLTKIGGTVTTRSNVFAVYLTVGFFEVIDDTTRPVKLGAEIRTRAGPPIRHRMFAIVDRTHLAIDDAATTPAPFVQAESLQPGAPFGSNMPRTRQFFVTSEDAVTDQEANGSYVKTFRVVGGMPASPIVTPMTYDGVDSTLYTPFLPAGQIRMYADVGVNQEPIICTINGDGSLSATFTKPHPAGFTLSFYRPGNPGPQGAIDLADPRFSGVVPYKTIIQ